MRGHRFFDGPVRGPMGRGGGRERSPFGGRGHDGERGHGPGHGRRGKRFDGDELKLMVLELLRAGPLHGYQLIRTIGERSGEGYAPSPGMLYPMLTLVADMGLVQEVADPSGGTRRSFGLTAEGEAEVAANRTTIDALFERLSGLADMAQRTGGGPVRRAMLNLRTAAIQRLEREGAGETLIFDVAAIIDEAAQKIERL